MPGLTAMVWDTEDKSSTTNKNMSRKKRNNRKNVTPEKNHEIEQRLGIQFIDFRRGILLYDGIIWRPVNDELEYLMAIFEYVPILTIHKELRFVPFAWQP